MKPLTRSELAEAKRRLRERSDVEKPSMMFWSEKHFDRQVFLTERVVGGPRDNDGPDVGDFVLFGDDLCQILAYTTVVRINARERSRGVRERSMNLEWIFVLRDFETGEMRGPLWADSLRSMNEMEVLAWASR